MPARSGPVHVATTTRKYKGRVYRTHLLRRTFREGGRVKHETLGNISHLPDEIIELVRLALRGETLVAAQDAFEILRALPHGHVLAVLGMLRKLDLESVIDPRRSRERDLVCALIVQRILDPRPKLSTAREIDPETACSSLCEVLGLGHVSEDDLYAAMDWLLARQPRIEQQLARRHLHDSSLVLYDVSSSYYTGTHCDLAKRGHSRDHRADLPQIVYGLLCDQHGRPVAIEVFEGNTGDPATLGVQIRKLRERFGLTRLVLVGDRGMITQARLDKEIACHEGLDWVTALRAPAIQALARSGVIQMSLFDQRDLVELSSPDYPDERLVACFNPLLAAERARNREELLAATEKRLGKIAAATLRTRRPLRGRDAIALAVGKVVNKNNVGKHFRLTITDTSFAFERDESRIASEAALDGVYVLRTSVPASGLSAEQTVSTYKRLSSVERAFRSLKTVDLKVRPIHHRRDDRVRAHVLLCMLAYYVEWHMREALAPILFDDDDPAAAQAARASVVAPARRSPQAQAKAATGRNADDLPVHSFQTLLRDLATLTLNRVRSSAADGAPEFELLAIPTVVQRRALDLLGVRVSTTA
jgi:hypothetical protein